MDILFGIIALILAGATYFQNKGRKYWKRRLEEERVLVLGYQDRVSTLAPYKDRADQWEKQAEIAIREKQEVLKRVQVLSLEADTMREGESILLKRVADFENSVSALQSVMGQVKKDKADADQKAEDAAGEVVKLLFESQHAQGRIEEQHATIVSLREEISSLMRANHDSRADLVRTLAEKDALENRFSRIENTDTTTMAATLEKYKQLADANARLYNTLLTKYRQAVDGDFDPEGARNAKGLIKRLEVENKRLQGENGRLRNQLGI